MKFYINFALYFIKNHLVYALYFVKNGLFFGLEKPRAFDPRGQKKSLCIEGGFKPLLVLINCLIGFGEKPYSFLQILL